MQKARIVSGWFKQTLGHVRDFVNNILYWGTERYCPICEKSSRKFRDYGIVPRKDAQCIHCGALERHRLIWLFFTRKSNLFDNKPKKVLHVAPEKFFVKRLKDYIGSGYITADLSDPQAMLKMDITDIQYPDEFFDVIYCSHVIEHILDDRRALREFYRVLRSDGWAVLLVPITSDKTFEDPLVIDPSERLSLFGQEDHVRRYGPDYIDRLRETGFRVQVIKPSDFLNYDEIVSMGITIASGDIYFCRK